MSWKASRIAFDAYQAKASKGEQLIEGRSTPVAADVLHPLFPSIRIFDSMKMI